MRPLTDVETNQLLQKLSKYIGPNTKHLFDVKKQKKSDDAEEKKGDAKKKQKDSSSSDSEEWVFRFHKNRVWYMPRKLEKLASSIARRNLMAIGVLFAKVTHHDNMRIQVTALEYLAKFAPYRVWVKPNQEQSFMYGNHITRTGLGRITENAPQHQGVVVMNMADVPIGFGVTSMSTLQCRKCEMNSTVLFHESDVGEFLRNEATLT